MTLRIRTLEPISVAAGTYEVDIRISTGTAGAIEEDITLPIGYSTLTIPSGTSVVIFDPDAAGTALFVSSIEEAGLIIANTTPSIFSIPSSVTEVTILNFSGVTGSATVTYI